MEVPALLPEELKYTSVAESDRNLFNMLVKIPQDYIVFFEYACGDETWSGTHHREFMESTLRWMTEQFFQDRFSVELAKRAVASIREHHSILGSMLPKNLSLQFNDTKKKINSLLWAGSSEYLRGLIRQECRDRGSKVLKVNVPSAEIIDQVEEFIATGSVQELWRKEQNEIIAVLNLATEWGLVELMRICEEILQRYIVQGNVIDFLIQSHEEGWGKLKNACIDFINDLEIGIRLQKGDVKHLSMEFLEFREAAMDIFNTLRFHITHLICSGSLTEKEEFTDVINRCPNMICLDISRSDNFTSRLLDIPESLEELDLSKCEWLSGKTLKKITEICPNLTRISLTSNIQLNYSAWGKLKDCGHLEKLDISRCSQVNDSDFKVVLQACRSVTHFYLEECTGLSDNAFFELGKNIPNLTDVNLSKCLLSDGALIDLALRCKHLITLSVKRCPGLSEKGILEAVQNAPNLKEIDITKCRLGQNAVNKIHEIRPFLNVIY